MARLVPSFVLDLHARRELAGSMPAATLFADISGFTDLCEKLTRGRRAGAEIVAEALRFYFDPPVNAVHDAGGFVVGFAGDAFTAVFPQGDDAPEDVAARALGAAMRTRAFFREHPTHENAFGRFPFSVKVGLSWDDVAWRIFPEHPATYLFRGPGIDACARAEQSCPPGGVALDRTFRASLRAPIDGSEAGDLFLVTGEPRGAPPSRAEPSLDAAAFCPPDVLAFPPTGEFRTVTAAFLSFDDRPGLDEFLGVVKVKAATYGGYLSRFDSGDKGCNALVFFGIPRAHENDLDHALAFCLDLKASDPFPFRAGITEDLGYAGYNGARDRHELTCLGRSTNLAARMMMGAAWGEALVTADVHDRARERFRFEERGSRRFKGFDDPVALFSLASRVAGKIAGKATRGIPATQGRMVGRRKELDLAFRHLNDAIARGGFVLLHVDGEPGAGKTLLVETLRERLAGMPGALPIAWIEAPADPILREALNPFRHALASQIALPSDAAARPAAFRAAWEILASQVGDPELQAELRRVESPGASLLGISWEGSLHGALEPRLRLGNQIQALRSWLWALAALRPVVLVLEDAQWIDAESRRALPAIVAAMSVPGPHGRAVVVASRLADDGTALRLPVSEIASSARVALGRMTPDELRALARQELHDFASDGLVELIAARTSGNPLFAQQVLGYLREAGALQSTADGLVVRGSATLPADAKSVLVARLDRLAPALRDTVQAAAVLGPTIELPILARMVEDETALPDLVREAEREQIWDPEGPDRYAFRHALLRDAAYEMQAGARLRKLHRKAAAAIESVHGDGDDSHQAELGRHWEHAGETGRARACYLAAARRAAEAFAAVDAERATRAFLALAPEREREAVRARVDLARFGLMRQGRHAEAAELLEETIRVAREEGFLDEEAQAMLQLGQLLADGAKPRALDLLGRARHVFREIGNVPDELRALAQIAQDYRLAARFDECRALIDEGLALSRRHGDRRSECVLLYNLGGLLMERGFLEESRAPFEGAIALANLLPAPSIEAFATAALSNVFFFDGRVEESFELCETAFAIHRRIGDRPGQANTLRILALQYVEVGDEEQARAYYGRARALYHELGLRRPELGLDVDLAMVELYAGNGDTCRALLDAAMPELDALGDVRGLGAAKECLGALHLQRGSLEDANGLLEEALATWDEVGNFAGSANVRVRLATLARTRGELSLAEPLLDRAEADIARVGDRFETIRIACERAQIARLRGIDVAPRLAELSRAARDLGAGPKSPCGRAIADLAAALAAR